MHLPAGRKTDQLTELFLPIASLCKGGLLVDFDKLAKQICLLVKGYS